MSPTGSFLTFFLLALRLLLSAVSSPEYDAYLLGRINFLYLSLNFRKSNLSPRKRVAKDDINMHKKLNKNATEKIAMKE